MNEYIFGSFIDFASIHGNIYLLDLYSHKEGWNVEFCVL
jgi:hypothetical protein